MISRPTVLVLGAGASVPYGYPTGRGLQKTVVGRSRNPPNALLIFGKAKLLEFADALEGSPSVDWFLERRPDRTDFADIGKQMMALHLLSAQSDAKLLDTQEDDWYSYLFERMETHKGKLGDNQLSIVTFNYDRSFERYLFLRMKRLYSLTDDDAVAETVPIEVVHVHGSLGDRAFKDIPYSGADLGSDMVKRASRGIRIVGEGDDSLEYKRARELLRSAKAVCFLGFGFQENNIARLELADIRKGIHSTPAGNWYATHKDLEKAEFNLLAEQLSGVFGEQAIDVGCLALLRRFPILR